MIASRVVLKTVDRAWTLAALATETTSCDKFQTRNERDETDHQRVNCTRSIETNVINAIDEIDRDR